MKAVCFDAKNTMIRVIKIINSVQHFVSKCICWHKLFWTQLSLTYL